MRTGVNVIIKCGQKTLLITHKTDGKLTAPGGSKEKKDKFLVDTGIREVHEETGIKLEYPNFQNRNIKGIPKPLTYYHTVHKNKKYVVFIFIAEISNECDIICEEGSEGSWVNISDIVYTEMYEPLIRYYKTFLN